MSTLSVWRFDTAERADTEQEKVLREAFAE